jgi:hypothetical protein
MVGSGSAPSRPAVSDQNQLWFARPGGPPISGGVFHVNDPGAALAVVVVPVTLEPVRAVAVTEDPDPGSLVPTGPHLLDRRT